MSRYAYWSFRFLLPNDSKPFPNFSQLASLRLTLPHADFQAKAAFTLTLAVTDKPS
jgi:hypothetical protein